MVDPGEVGGAERMANEEHLAILRQGVEAWNAWRRQHNGVRPNLHGAVLAGANLFGADLSDASLTDANLRGADLERAQLQSALLMMADLGEANLSSAFLPGANFTLARLVGTKLAWAHLSQAILIGADLTGAGLHRATLREADLNNAVLTRADLRGADLRFASMVRANMAYADLTGCHVFGTAAWKVNLLGAKQDDLVITDFGEPKVTVDDLEVAQFVYLLLNNERFRHVIDTITSKAVLILGRFTPERKAVLDALREELRGRDYLPILFDFGKPAGKDLTGTVQTLANMARFVVADLTDPSSVPHELAMVVPHTVVPVQPVLLGEQPEYAMFVDLKRRYRWVLEPYRYASPERLIADLGERVIDPAEAKVRDLRAGL
jgi:uncharacterized protein YjbI with pentapeptide repeats